jgi:hypothetical protein
VLNRNVTNTDYPRQMTSVDPDDREAAPPGSRSGAGSESVRMYLDSAPQVESSASLIQPGDVARCGDGPPMNVRSINGARVVCTWYDVSGKRQVEMFDLTSLSLTHQIRHLDARGRPHSS